MKIVISGHEICGLIHDLAEELGSRGHAVTTIVLPHKYFPYSYDYDQYDLPVSVLGRRYGSPELWRGAFKVLWELNSDWHKSIETRLRVALLRGADLYIRVWGYVPFDREVLSVLEKRGTKVATLLMGSDVRDYQVFAQQYGMKPLNLPAEYRVPTLEQKLNVLRTHERYADAIFSVPDQMGLSLRPYHHLQVPLDLRRLKFNVTAREIPKVVHAPSSPELKGTDKIEAALASLRNEGCEFEFVSLRDMSHAKVLDLLSDADVLVDELVAHGPGWLSFEAMASGCAVATKYLQDSPDCFRPPVVAIDEQNLEDRLRTLLTDRNLRARLAEEGRRYVETNNRIDGVVDTLLEKTASGRAAAHDYEPTYLLNDYVPPSDAETRAINQANELVRCESWYQSRIAGHMRDGLKF